MFGREAIIELEKPYSKKLVKYNGLDVKFSINTVPGSFQWKANISVLNLPRNIVQYYAKEIGIKSDLTFANRPRVRLSVRYCDTHKQAVCIFDGRVMLARVTPAPDVWLNMDCQTDSSGGDTETFKVSLSGINSTYKIKDICNEIGKATNTVPVYYGDWGDQDKYYIEGFCVEGTIMQLYGNTLNMMNKDLMVTTMPVANDKRYYIGPSDADGMNALAEVIKGKSKDNASEMTEENGVIGIPSPELNHLRLTTLLRPEERPLTYVKVKLKHFPVMDGTYLINSLRHTGQLRQGQWVTIFDLTRDNVSNFKGEN